MDLEKEIGHQCMATAICRYTGSIVRCQKIANHKGVHTFAGLQWEDLDIFIAITSSTAGI